MRGTTNEGSAMGRAHASTARHMLGSNGAAPFVKWAGGKRQLIASLHRMLPSAFGRYIEPFVGGGALFFHLHKHARLSQGAVLNDLNEELVNCYRVIQDETSLPQLVRQLRWHCGRVMSAEHYYRVRAWDRDPRFKKRRTPVQRAARTIFLNHACYNGLYRVNRKGQFNVPYGRWARRPAVYDEANLWACHRALQHAELHAAGFESTVAWARAGDFVYFDPPYHPLSPTSSFTTYTGSEFGEEHQRRLAAVFEALDKRGCLLMQSNSSAPFIQELYRGFSLDTVLATRAINCKAAMRGKIKEVVIRNY